MVAHPTLYQRLLNWWDNNLGGATVHVTPVGWCVLASLAMVLIVALAMRKR